MRFNRIILAISCGAGLALVGACSDGGSHLTSPANRVPAAKATVGDTFCCGITTKAKPATTTNTSPTGN